jgi:hypothetical protein
MPTWFLAPIAGLILPTLFGFQHREHSEPTEVPDQLAHGESRWTQAQLCPQPGPGKFLPLSHSPLGGYR